MGHQIEERRKVGSSIYIAIVCFLTYACVYAFRKPFTIGLYANEPSYLGVDFKNILVISQVLGYALSKIYGIKFVSELGKLGRCRSILILIGISWIPLIFFPYIPAPFNFICFFINGFPLGIIWGIIFSYVEGRKRTDFIGASLAVSFIVSSGVVKSVAKWLQLTYSITDKWIPFITGLVFLLPLVLLIYLLEKVSDPSEEEKKLKAPRSPMSKNERAHFFYQFRFGLIAFIVIYIMLTLFRDLRDNYAADIWVNLGYNNAAMFTNTELPIALVILAIIASMVFVKNNRWAFLMSQIAIIIGFFIAGVSTYFFQQHIITGYSWMLLVGLGLYMGYIPFNSILFDRMIATFRLKGNVGFLMYLMDSFGYLASVAVIVLKNAMHVKLNWATFYSDGVLVVSIAGFILAIITMVYYIKQTKNIKYEQ